VPVLPLNVETPLLPPELMIQFELETPEHATREKQEYETLFVVSKYWSPSTESGNEPGAPAPDHRATLEETRKLKL
jgi:hypothetical protein